VTEGRNARGVRVFLDSWKPWVGVAYVALVVMIVVLFFFNQDLAREQAAREATQRAGAISQRDNCLRMVENNPDLIAIIDAVQLNAQNNAESARAALAIEPEGPLANVRRASIARANAAIAAAQQFKEQIESTTPTLADCVALAKRLGVPVGDAAG